MLQAVKRQDWVPFRLFTDWVAPCSNCSTCHPIAGPFLPGLPWSVATYHLVLTLTHSVWFFWHSLYNFILNVEWILKTAEEMGLDRWTVSAVTDEAHCSTDHLRYCFRAVVFLWSGLMNKRNPDRKQSLKMVSPFYLHFLFLQSVYFPVLRLKMAQCGI